MKTVTGSVISSKPISLSKAASILSKFVSTETGASQAVCAYLRRASISFNELSQSHKEMKPNRKHKTRKLKTVTEDENPTRSAISSQQPSQRELSHGIGSDFGVESENNEHKKKRSEIENLEENKGEMGIEEAGKLGIESQREKKKHIKEKGKTGDKIVNSEEAKGKAGIEEDGDVGIESDRKKRKKKKEKSGSEISNVKENGGGIVIEDEERKKKKKRKSEEVENGMEMNSEDLHSKKKKKRKTEGQS